jgi:hypothetical protein
MGKHDILLQYGLELRLRERDNIDTNEEASLNEDDEGVL